MVAMRYRSTNTTGYSAKCHRIWCPTYRRRVLVGGVAERLKAIIAEVAAGVGAAVIGAEVIEVEVIEVEVIEVEVRRAGEGSVVAAVAHRVPASAASAGAVAPVVVCVHGHGRRRGPGGRPPVCVGGEPEGGSAKVSRARKRPKDAPTFVATISLRATPA